MAVLRIGSSPSTLQDVPDPAHGGFTVSLQDIDAANAGRSANGTMIRDRVCGAANAKRKLEIQWPPMNSEQTAALLQAVKDTFFYVEYPDPYTGARRTAQFYAGDRTAPVYWVVGGEVLWESIRFNLVEK